tara:strand:- start:105 stop:371 length:267 start_codon:yes stop_codon:yes gene_type:complete
MKSSLFGAGAKVAVPDARAFGSMAGLNSRTNVRHRYGSHLYRFTQNKVYQDLGCVYKPFDEQEQCLVKGGVGKKACCPPTLGLLFKHR